MNQAQDDVLKLLDVSDQQSKTKRYSFYNHVEQKIFTEGEMSKCFPFFLINNFCWSTNRSINKLF